MDDGWVAFLSNSDTTRDHCGLLQVGQTQCMLYMECLGMVPPRHAYDSNLPLAIVLTGRSGQWVSEGEVKVLIPMGVKWF